MRPRARRTSRRSVDQPQTRFAAPAAGQLSKTHGFFDAWECVLVTVKPGWPLVQVLVAVVQVEPDDSVNPGSAEQLPALYPSWSTYYASSPVAPLRASDAIRAL